MIAMYTEAYTEEELERIRAETLNLREKGYTIRSIALMLGVPYQALKYQMQHYEPSRELTRKRIAENRARNDKIKAMYMEGKSNQEIAEAFGLKTSVVNNIIYYYLNPAERKRQKPVEPEMTEMEEALSKTAIYLTDVERFKALVNEGAEIAYDVSEIGLPLMCRVEKKYPHIALTDQGCFEWTWLTVMNRKVIGK